MSTARRVHYSYEDYVRALEDSEIKLEYFDGEIYAMAGGTLAHAELGARVIGQLSQSLAGGCRVFTSDAKVQVEATGLTTFPDATVACGETRDAANDRNALVNPTILVEVTGKGNRGLRPGGKAQPVPADSFARGGAARFASIAAGHDPRADCYRLDHA